jgi:hypothetical protein
MAADGHGEGGQEECRAGQVSCEGLICECWEHFDVNSPEYKRTEAPDHGQVFDNVCTVAVCRHCGWAGGLPKPPKKLLAWEKKALEAGWMPPENWDKL